MPALVAIVAALVDLVAALVIIAKALAASVAIWAILELLFDPKGSTKVGQFLTNIITGAFAFAGPLIGGLETQLAGIATDFVTSMAKQGSGISNVITGPAAAPAVENQQMWQR